jgi:pimeloyl-ACP methyl ester carboxylesterase
VEQRALLVETPSLEAALPTLSVPTAVVAGQRDRIVPPRAARDLSAAIPGAELVWVGAAGHRLPRLAPAALAAVIHRYAGDFGRRDDSEV